MSKQVGTEDAMLRAVAKYLELKGWSVAVIGAKCIQGPVDLDFNYEFVLKFTGVKRESEQEKTK